MKKLVGSVIVSGLAAVSIVGIGSLAQFGSAAHADEPVSARDEVRQFKDIFDPYRERVGMDSLDATGPVMTAKISFPAALSSGAAPALLFPGWDDRDSDGANRANSLAARYGFKGTIFPNTSPDLPMMGYEEGGDIARAKVASVADPFAGVGSEAATLGLVEREYTGTSPDLPMMGYEEASGARVNNASLAPTTWDMEAEAMGLFERGYTGYTDASSDLPLMGHAGGGDK